MDLTRANILNIADRINEQGSITVTFRRGLKISEFVIEALRHAGAGGFSTSELHRGWNAYYNITKGKRSSYNSFKTTMSYLVKSGKVERLSLNESKAMGLDLGRRDFPKTYYVLPSGVISSVKKPSRSKI